MFNASNFRSPEMDDPVHNFRGHREIASFEILKKIEFLAQICRWPWKSLSSNLDKLNFRA